MKNNSLIRLIFVLTVACMPIYNQMAFGQIKVLQENETKQVNKNRVEYDARTNVVAINGDFSHLVGERLMLVHSGVKSAKTDKFVGDVYSYSHLFSSELKQINDELYFQKIFKVIANTSTGCKGYLTLQCVDNNEILYYPDKELYYCANSVFVCESFFNKMKENYIGKEYVFAEASNKSLTLGPGYQLSENCLRKKDTVLKYKPQSGSIWKCVDVVVKIDTKNYHDQVNSRCPIILVFENKEGEQTFQYLQNMKGETSYLERGVVYPKRYDLFLGCFIEKSNADVYLNSLSLPSKEIEKDKAKRWSKLVKKYGLTNTKLIANGLIEKGFSKEMCIEAWGEPTSKYSGSTMENWSFEYGEVFFKDELVSFFRERKYY